MTTLLRFAALAAVLVVAMGCGNTTSSSAPTLSGTSWTIVSINRFPTVATAQPTADFGADGKVSGNAGCNTYNGTYTVTGDNITVSPLISTRIACASADITTQEGAFLEALSRATHWSIDQGNLSLTGFKNIVGSPKT